MWVDKERVRRYYRQLLEDLPDLCHSEKEYARMWVERARNLRLVGAWWHYMLVIVQAKRYVRKNCPFYYERLLSLLKASSEVCK